MKANFNIKKDKLEQNVKNPQTDVIPDKNFTKEEFEEFILKSGAKGSFMIYRSVKKDDELGLEEL
jgi:hypothetical protein